MASFTGYIVEVTEEFIRVAPRPDTDRFDGIVFRMDEQFTHREPLVVGQQVRVEHDEQLTRSLPPQATAHRIDVL